MSIYDQTFDDVKQWETLTLPTITSTDGLNTYLADWWMGAAWLVQDFEDIAADWYSMYGGFYDEYSNLVIVINHYLPYVDFSAGGTKNGESFGACFYRVCGGGFYAYYASGYSYAHWQVSFIASASVSASVPTPPASYSDWYNNPSTFYTSNGLRTLYYGSWDSWEAAAAGTQYMFYMMIYGVDAYYDTSAEQTLEVVTWTSASSDGTNSVNTVTMDWQFAGAATTIGATAAISACLLGAAALM